MRKWGTWHGRIHIKDTEVCNQNLNMLPRRYELLVSSHFSCKMNANGSDNLLWENNSFGHRSVGSWSITMLPEEKAEWSNELVNWIYVRHNVTIPIFIQNCSCIFHVLFIWIKLERLLFLGTWGLHKRERNFWFRNHCILSWIWVWYQNL